MSKRNLIIIAIIIVALAAALFALLPGAMSKYNFTKGIEAINSGDYEEAIIYLQKSDSSDAEEIIASARHHQKALAAYEAGDYVDSYTEAGSVAESYPQYAAVQKLYNNALNYVKGMEAFNRGEYKEAVNYLQKSDSSDAVEMVESIKRHQEAMASYEDGNYREAYIEAGLVPESYPLYNEVQELYNDALKQMVAENLMDAKKYFADEKYMEAYKRLGAVLKYDPQNSEALLLKDIYFTKSEEMKAKIELMGRFLTDSNSISQRKMVNIDEWNEAGYTGKGLTILHDDTGDTSHSKACASIIQTILPDATVIRGNISGKSNGAGVYEANISRYDTDEMLPFDEAIIKWNISMINNSTDGGDDDNDSGWAVFMSERIKRYNLVCTGAAGNRGGMTNPFQGAFIIVGSVAWNGGDPQKYGASGDAIDFSMFTGYQPGTSFASPFLCGMAGLLKSKDPTITQDWVYQYFKENSMHLGTDGKNPDYGWGLPIMGSPTGLR